MWGAGWRWGAGGASGQAGVSLSLFSFVFCFKNPCCLTLERRLRGRSALVQVYVQIPKHQQCVFITVVLRRGELTG